MAAPMLWPAAPSHPVGLLGPLQPEAITTPPGAQMVAPQVPPLALPPRLMSTPQVVLFFTVMQSPSRLRAYTAPGSVCHTTPAVARAATVPCGFTGEGLPVGLQIVGRPDADATVLRAAAGFEAVQPWAQKRPPLG